MLSSDNSGAHGGRCRGLILAVSKERPGSSIH